jgi:hypothetical protein
MDQQYLGGGLPNSNGKGDESIAKLSSNTSPHSTEASNIGVGSCSGPENGVSSSNLKAPPGLASENLLVGVICSSDFTTHFDFKESVTFWISATTLGRFRERVSAWWRGVVPTGENKRKDSEVRPEFVRNYLSFTHTCFL